MGTLLYFTVFVAVVDVAIVYVIAAASVVVVVVVVVVVFLVVVVIIDFVTILFLMLSLILFEVDTRLIDPNLCSNIIMNIYHKLLISS